ncbi:MAG: response regulator [Campylobacterales bacterium]|nr:response regulator [Campylobacterales bacterium]
MVDFSVLVCEDDETTREFLVRRLSRILEKVYEAGDGEEGLKLYTEHSPDLIITDINMPKLDGISMIKEIRKRDKKTSIVVVSAFSDHENLLECIENGVDSYLVKPVDNRKLLDSITKLREIKRLEISHKQSDKILQDYKKALDAGSIVSVTDTKGVFTDVNEAFCQVTGYTKEELIGQSQKILKHPNTPDSDYQKMLATISNGDIYHGVLENKTKDGNSFVADMTIVPIKNGYDGIDEYIILHHNLTNITTSYERNLEGIINHSDDLKIVLDDTYSPVMFNQTFKEQFGDIFEENQYKLCGVLFEDRDDCLEPVNLTYEEFVYQFQLSNIVSQKIKVICENDTYKLYMVRIKKVTNEMIRSKDYQIITFVDITQFEQMKNEQLSSSKLAYIGQLSASITHEINTPLTYIKGNLELLRMDIEDFVTDEKNRSSILETMDTMEGGIERIASIVNTMRETTGVSENRPVQANLYRTVIYALRMLYAKFKHITPVYINGQEFSLQLDQEHEKYMAFVAPQRIEQVWIIIINNALDELEKNDKPYSQRHLKIEIDILDSKVRILFKDNGGGVDNTVIDKIFDSFVSTKKSENSSGMGLGLNIAKTIVDSNNGTIDVYNEKGGAVFKIEFDSLKD